MIQNGEDEASKAKPGDENYDMLDAIAEDMIMALDKKDTSMLKDALGALCDYIKEEDIEQDEEMGS